MPPPGGLADKIGNRYEGRIAVWRILQLLDEQHDSVQVRFEKPGDDKFEWWVQREDESRTYTQVKRQQSVDDEWTVGTLISRGVIPAFGERLRQEPDAHCEFFSALSASHLQQLSDDARMAGSLEEFEREFAGAEAKKRSWEKIRGAWPGTTAEEAWQLLRRVTAGNIDEPTLLETLRAHARALVNAPADDVIGRLGDFLDDHLAVELTAHDVWDFLRAQGYRPADWSRDQSVCARIDDETDRYRSGITADRARQAEIRRSAAAVIAGLLADPAGPAVVTVAADAGAGKTGLLGQILDNLQAMAATDPDDGLPRVVLATRLDRLDRFRDGHELGKALRLPASPAAVLSRVAAGRPALLVLDQVDAFGAGSGRDPARLEAVTETLKDARALGIKVMIACRSFDLEIDHRLAALAGVTGRGQLAQGHHVERLGALPDSDVEDSLRAAGIEPSRLTGSLRELLSVPLHLHMLIALQERGKLDPAGISTRLQLFGEFYATVRAEAEERQPNAPVAEVSGRLAELLSERQELSAAPSRLGDLQTTVESLARVGWLRLDRAQVAFAHEAFFDYAYAQQHMRAGVPLLTVLRAGEQLLFRRAQVRQILALEREQDHGQYLRDVQEILAAADVRAHLKELVVALVTLAHDPGLDEWQALGVLGDPMKDPLAERACWLAAQSEGFRRLLLGSGIVSGYLSDSGTADLGIWLCMLMVRDHPDEVAALLLPYAGREGWPGRLARVLNAAPLARSEPAVTLVIAFIDAGGFDAAMGDSDRDKGSVFSLMHGFGDASAASGSRLVAAWLRRRLALLTAGGTYGPPSGAAGDERDAAAGGSAGQGAGEGGEVPASGAAGQESVADFLERWHAEGSRRLLGDSMDAPEILASLAAGGPAAFTRDILPVVRQASSASRTGLAGPDGEWDDAFGTPPPRAPGYSANDSLLARLAEAIRDAAGAGDPETHSAVRDMAGSALATEQFLAATGFASGHPDLIGDAAAWLLAGPHALDQGWHDDRRGLSADVLAQVCTQLPAEETRPVQERVAAHATRFELEERGAVYGAAAWRLLRDVPDASLTGEARARKSELGRKFPQPTAAAPAAVMDIFVRSPIDGADVRRMSDEHLVNAMRRWSSDEWQPEPSGRLRGGATTFAGVLSAAAQENPARLTAVIESLPDDIAPVYTTHILSGLSRAATPEQSLRAAWAARAHTATSGTQVSQLIERAAPVLDEALLTTVGLAEDDVLGLLRQVLAQPPAPAGGGSVGWGPEQPSAPEVTGQKLAERLMSRALNRPEYAALRALVALAPRFPGADALLASQLGQLASSPALAVRALVIEMSQTQYAAAGPAAVMAIVGKALDSPGVMADTGPDPLPADSRILLASFQLRALLLRLCWPHYDIVAPVLDRMTSFSDTTAAKAAAGVTAAAEQAAQNASMIAAVAACRNPEAIALTQQMAGRQLPFRRGITAALAQILPLGEMPDELTEILVGFLDDADDDLAMLAGSALMRLPAGRDDLAGRLLSAACQARTFALEPARVVTAADRYQGSIPGTGLEIAERFFSLHQSQASDLRGSGAHAAEVLGRIVIGIYAQAEQDLPFASRILNLIDAMVFARSYGLEEQLAKLDR
jgi:hypothetical protein